MFEKKKNRKNSCCFLPPYFLPFLSPLFFCRFPPARSRLERAPAAAIDRRSVVVLVPLAVRSRGPGCRRRRRRERQVGAARASDAASSVGLRVRVSGSDGVAFVRCGPLPLLGLARDYRRSVGGGAHAGGT